MTSPKEKITKMNSLFPDISENQPNMDASALRKMTEAVSIRISYGKRLDKKFAWRIADIRRNNFTAVIYYLFMRSANTVDEQFQTVTSALPTLQEGEAVCVDWETDLDKSRPGISNRDTLLSKLDAFYGQPTILYGSASSLSGLRTDRPLWIASYGVKTEPTQAHLIWQYTDGIYSSAGIAPVNWPGGLGKIDSNVFHGDAATLAHLIHPSGGSVSKLNAPIIGVWYTSTGQGYWQIGADGGVFAYGDAHFYGSMANEKLAAPITGFASTPNNDGYILTGADGGLFRFGNAPYFGQANI